MKQRIKTGLAVVALSLCLNTNAFGGEFEDGYAAQQRGDFATAHRLWQPLATQGHFGAQFNLGLMFDKGEGVPQDYAEAVKWYRKAAEQGISLAQNSLGFMYAKGLGVPQNYVQAHKWFNLSAANDKDETQRKRAAFNRDLVAEKMTASQIAEAQKLGQEWSPKSSTLGN